MKNWLKNLTGFEILAAIYVAFVVGWAIVLWISEFNNK